MQMYCQKFSLFFLSDFGLDCAVMYVSRFSQSFSCTVFAYIMLSRMSLNHEKILIENLGEGVEGGCATCVIALKQEVTGDFFLQA